MPALLGLGAWAGVVELAGRFVSYLGGLDDDNTFADGPVSAAFVRALAGSPLARTVRVLAVPLTVGVVDALADLPADAPLEALDDMGWSGRASIDRGAWERLAAGPMRARLAALRLDRLEVADDGVRALTAAGPWGRLEHLSLAGNRIGDDGAVQLATAGPSATLRTLDLSGNRIGAAGADALISGLRAGPLERLDLSNNRIGWRAARRLRAAFGDRVGL